MIKKVLAICFILLLAGAVHAARRQAMLVGIQNYDAYNQLNSCHGDVDDMKAMLMQGGFEAEFIWPLKDELGEIITASKLFSSVTAFARGISEGDKVIFFFSGHGIGDKSGENYLLGYDGNMDAPEKFSVRVSEIKEILKEKKPAEIVMIIDACRSYMKKKGKGAGKEIKGHLNTGKGVTLREQQARIKLTAENSGGAGQTNQSSGRGTIVKTIYAASEGQQSFERSRDNNGAFTYYLTYLVDSPNSAMDVDMSKDGVISIEDMVLFADNRLAEFTKRENLPDMNPVYQTDGGIVYQPFMLFRYNAEQEVQTRKEKKIEPVFRYDEHAELKKIKKYQEDLSYMDEKLPLYKPQDFSKDELKVEDLDATDLSSWQIENLKNKYNTVIQKLDRTDDLFKKYEMLEDLRSEVNRAKYPEIKQKILVLLEPVYEKIKQAKQDKEQEIAKLETKFENDLSSMENMRQSSLPAEAKQKYLAAFKEKWTEYVKLLRNDNLMSRYKTLFLTPVGSVETVSVNGVDIELVYVPGGTFMMGSPSNEDNRDNDEVQHPVTLTDGFWIGKYEVTQEQWQAVMGNNPSNFKGDKRPVEQVSWNDCQEFIQKLNRQTGQNFALPTEAQWEYAARGGPLSKGYIYSGSNNIDDVAEYDGNNNKSTKPVGGRQANELGIYDMSGNVWEWCGDWYGDYPGRSVTNPTGPSSGSNRVLRGGGWLVNARYCRSAYRLNLIPSARHRNLGFRLVRH